MHRSTLNRLLVTLFAAIVVSIAAALPHDQAGLIAASCCALLAVAGFLYGFDYLHPAVAYLLPWLMILIFSVIPISIHARAMEDETYRVLIGTAFAWMLGCVGYARSRARDRASTEMPAPGADVKGELRGSQRRIVAAAFFALYGFAALNVMIAGYLPLLSSITTGNSRYDEFGIPSVYGAFLAYANALGCLAFYIYLRTGRRAYLALFVSVFVMHIALVTRQNALTLLVEAFVMRCVVVKRVSQFALVAVIAVVLAGFSALGSLRSGNISEVIGVLPEYAWIPTSLIWVYAYSYFNALNIDNMIANSGAPFFDGYMWQTLLPTVLRTTINHGVYLELSSMTVSSYILPVYIDIGPVVLVWAFLLGLLTTTSYRRACLQPSFLNASTYGCLYFCALMSFFTNFWLYLPVISQLFFFWILSRLLFKPTTSHLGLPVAS
jgi:oligosaccharide repeat unit polymerase